MKKSACFSALGTFAILVSVTTQLTPARAGVGGYSSTTCVSASGRTVLTMARDNGSSERMVVNLIMDGQTTRFDSSDPRVTFLVSEEDHMIGKIDGSTHFGIGAGSKATLRVVSDPRTGTFAESNSKGEAEQLIKVTCKTFVQQP